MNPTLVRALVALVPILILLFGAATLYSRIKTVSSLAQVLGALCFIVVGLAHVCEALNLFPSMGWGARGSTGHYVNLVSTVLGSGLFLAGYVCHALGRRDTHAA